MNTLRRTLHLVLALLLAAAPFPAAAEATATLEGTVTDQNGYPLPGVSVEAKGPTLKDTRVVVTDAAGHFKFPTLPVGTYDVSTKLAGFESIVQKIVLPANGLNLALSMQISGVMQEIVVSAHADTISETHTAATTFSDDKAQKRPTSSNFSSATQLKLPRESAESARQNTKPISGTRSFENFYSVGGAVAAPRTPPKTADGRTTAVTGTGFSPLPILNAKPFADMFFRNFGVNPTVETEEEATSTFSASVDTASYTLARSYLNRGAMPDADGVRVEEFVNYFDYRYDPPKDGAPFALHAEAFPSPNRKGYHVLHLGLKGRTVDAEDRKPATLVFCVDVSGSMDIENRLGLVKRALRLLVNELDERDQVGIVVYGTNARVLLEPVNATRKEEILAAVEQLRAEGSTNAQAGIREAYRMCARHLRPGQTNRIVLCTDGVANNGTTDADEIFSEVKHEADRGITVTAVGFGMGNYNDVLLERLAQVGHGNYAYVDRLEEARRIFVTQLTGTLQVIAKDVKIQVEFDPETVSRYRLLGFESRPLTKEEFENDRVDAGNVGAGHAVTALYEIKLKASASSSHLGSLRIRYKDPDGSRSRLLAKGLTRSIVRGSAGQASSPARLSFVAASFAEKLRGSYWVRNLSYEDLLAACDGLGERVRERSDVAELRGLVAAAQRLDVRGDRFENMAPIAQMDFDRVPVLR